MIRSLMKRDVEKVRSIHEEFYKNEFDISQLNNLTCGFTAVDEYDNIISAGGIRTIMEMIIVTDKNYDVAKRQVALYDMLKTAGNTTKTAGYNNLHAFIQDEKWARYLIKHVGFKPVVGTSLIIGV